MTTQIDSSAIYICLAGFVSPLGTYTTNQRVRGGDPGVAANPRYFIADGGTTEETHAALQALAPPIPSESTNPRVILGRDPTAADYVACVRAVQPIAATGFGGGFVPGAAVGDVVRKDTELVRLHPKAFRPARPEEVPARK